VGEQEPKIEVRDLTMAYGDFVIQERISFQVEPGEIFILMGDSGSGKSSLLRHMIGLHEPAKGGILYDGVDLVSLEGEERGALLRSLGVSFQAGALWSSMTLAQNIGLPLEAYTDLSKAEIRELASLKLSLVGLSGFEDFLPSEISGGMAKRAALARALALDPDVLFFDEPSAGLDPLSARRLDELILELRDSLGATIVVVTHELASIFAIGTNSIFLDSDERTMVASGPPRELLETCTHDKVSRFLRRGETA
jgi:phospholipid/cholesterol/gamma-HCH transport system ATP-binding protein